MWLALLFACTGKEDGANDPPPLALDDTGGDCTSVPPDIDDISVSNGGQITGEGGDPDWSIRVDIHFVDPDLDVDVADIHYWWDDTVDGVVDVSGAPDITTGPFKIDSDGEACRVSGGSFGELLGIRGRFVYNTWYDFGVTITDAHGLESDAAFASGVTPKEDGSDGDPR